MVMDKVIFVITVTAALFDILFQITVMLRKRWCTNGDWAIAQFLMAAGALSYLLRNALEDKQIYQIYVVLLIVCIAVFTVLKIFHICFFRVQGAKKKLGKAVANMVEQFREERQIDQNSLTIYGNIEEEGTGILVFKDIPKDMRIALMKKITVFLDKYGYSINLGCVLLILLDIAALIIVFSMFL